MTCSTNNLTSEDKHRILSVLPKSSNRIFAMARGKIYHAPFPSPNSNDWKPLNFHGAIIFGRDSRTGEHQDGSSSSSSLSRQLEDWDYNHTEDDDPWFRLVELDGRKGTRVVWRQGLSTTSSDYRMLVPFFHVFSGNSRMFGFKFEDDAEASRFYQTVMYRTKEGAVIKANPLRKSRSRTIHSRRSTILNSAGIPHSPCLIVTNPDPPSPLHSMYATSKAGNNILVEDEVDDRRFPREKLSRKITSWIGLMNINKRS